MTITAENYNQYYILYVEEELSPELVAELRQFILDNPKYGVVV
jgi:hypothetical protein